MKRASGFLIALISVFGINFIPLEMFLYRDFSAESAMIFYALENFLAIAFAIVFVWLFAPAEEENPDFGRRRKVLETHPAFPVESTRKKSEILKSYLGFAIPFSVGGCFFLVMFSLIALKVTIQVDSILSGLIWIAGFLCLEFIGDMLMLRPLTLAATETFLKRSMGRVALLFLSAFVGVFLALAVDSWFVIPFIALKTLADVGEIIQIFKSDKPPKRRRLSSP